MEQRLSAMDEDDHCRPGRTSSMMSMKAVREDCPIYNSLNGRGRSSQTACGATACRFIH